MTFLERMISIVAPHACLICGAEGAIMCEPCASLEIMPVPPRCYKCMASTLESAVCTKCRRKTSLKHVWVRSVYEDKVADLMIAYKYERAKDAHKVIARQMAETLPFLDKETLIAPVPTATSRVRQRGYDHSLLIAKEISRTTGLLYARPATRFGQIHQFGANRKDRLTQLKDVFYVARNEQVQGKSILIVDDVLTTGSTLEVFAKQLKKAGAKQINAVVFAQKL